MALQTQKQGATSERRSTNPTPRHSSQRASASASVSDLVHSMDFPVGEVFSDSGEGASVQMVSGGCGNVEARADGGKGKVIAVSENDQ